MSLSHSREPAMAQAANRKRANVFFGVWFAVLVALVTVPPLYLAASGADPWIVVPFSVGFLLVHGLACVLLVWMLYRSELRSGEIERFIDERETAR